MHPNQITVSEISGLRCRSAVAVLTGTREPINPRLLTGIEVEGEEACLPESASYMLSDGGWLTHDDGSLRESGIELVLREPLYGTELSGAIDVLFNAWDEGLEFYPSPRAGTHIHLNMTDRPLSHLQSLTALMYCFDPIVFRLAGEDRQWCSYANSLSSIKPNALQALLSERGVDRGEWWRVWPVDSSDRYYGFNISSIGKYGSVEFRHFPTPESKDQLWTWIDLCHALYDASAEWQNSDSPAKAVLEAAQENPYRILNILEEACKRPLAFDGWEEEVKALAEDLYITLSVKPAEERAYSTPRPFDNDVQHLLGMLRYSTVDIQAAHQAHQTEQAAVSDSQQTPGWALHADPPHSISLDDNEQHEEL